MTHIAKTRPAHILEGDNWQRLTKQTNWQFPGGRVREKLFATHPEAIFTRRPSKLSGEHVPFRVLCEHANCRRTMHSSAAAFNSLRCSLHGKNQILGHAVKSAHLLALKELIVEIQKKPFGQKGFFYFIACASGCGNRVDVTRRKQAQKRLCAACAKSARQAKKNSRRIARSHLDIVAYQIGSHSGRNYRRPMRRCEGLHCEALIRFDWHAPKRARGLTLCKKCRSITKRKEPFEARFNVLRRSSAERKIFFDLSLPFYDGLLRGGKCHYCHFLLNAQPHQIPGVRHRGYAGMLDRKDNTSGYTEDNVVPCCVSCNLIKGQVTSYEQMLCFGAVIRGDEKAILHLMAEHKHALLEHKRMLEAAENIWAINSRRSSRGACADLGRVDVDICGI